MEKEHWHNLWRSYRVFKRRHGHIEALLAIAEFCYSDAIVVHRLTEQQ